MRQPHLAGPLPPRGRHHRRDQRLHRPRPPPPTTPTAWSPINAKAASSTPPPGRPPWPTGRRTGWAPWTWRSAPRTSTAACCAATSCPAGAITAWPTSPGSRPPPGPKQLRDQGYSPVTVSSDDEAAVAAAGRRGRGTPHPGQPDPGPAPRTTPQRTPGRTHVGHPLRGARGRRQHRPAAHRRAGRRAADRHRRLDRGPMGRDRRPAAHATPTSTTASSSSTRSSAP